MSWSGDFIAGLGEATTALRWIVEVVQVNNEPGRPWSCASHRGLADSRCISVRGVRQQGSTLSPRSWSTSVGVVTVELVGDIGEFHQRVTRGTVLAVLCGLPGMADTDFQRVAIGPYRSMRAGRSDRFTIEILDLFSAMTQRWDTATYANSLFQGVEGGSTLAAAYTAGDGSIEVASTSPFQRETGETGAVLVTPSSGDPFYLTYTGTASSPTRLTGLSATGQLGTTAVNAASGNSVTNVAYLYGHPLEIVRKILTSRGGGTNGSFDTLPAYWGLGLAYDLLDHDDINNWQNNVLVATSGSYYWEMVVPEAVDDAYGWITDTWAQAGIFPTIRQGKITWRAAQDTLLGLFDSGMVINDEDVVEIVSYEDYDAADHGVEYEAVGCFDMLGRGASQSETPATIPMESTMLQYVVDGLWGAWVGVTGEMIDRLAESGLRVPEKLTLRLSRGRWARLANGELVTLNITRPRSRRDGTLGFRDRPAVVVEVSPDWSAWTVTVTVLVYPDTGDQFA